MNCKANTMLKAYDVISHRTKEFDPNRISAYAEDDFRKGIWHLLFRNTKKDETMAVKEKDFKRIFKYIPIVDETTGNVYELKEKNYAY